MEAQTYAGDGTVYEQVVNIDDIAWIDPTQGQYAKVEAGLDNSAFSMPENDDEVNYSFEITPEQDAEYLDAVNNGDMEATQRMVDEAAERAGYTVKGYHGTSSGGFTVFNKSIDEMSKKLLKFIILQSLFYNYYC